MNPFVARRLGPAGCWISWEPRVWPAPPVVVYRPSTHDVALPRPAGRDRPPELEVVPVAIDDVVLLPAVGELGREERDRWCRMLQAAGVPVVVQLVAGEAPTGSLVEALSAAAQSGGSAELAGESVQPPGSSVTVLFDPLAALLADDLTAAAAAPTGSVALWPLVAGLTDDPDRYQRILRSWVDRGVSAVLVVRCEPSPDARRVLHDLATAHRGEQFGADSWEALFHRPAPAEREFMALAWRHGLAPFPARPPLAGNAVRTHNRRLAADLLVVAELSSRLDHSAALAAELQAAARRIDALPRDICAIWRDGNLGVLDWLGSPLDEWIAGWCATGALPRFGELRDEVLAANATRSAADRNKEE